MKKETSRTAKTTRNIAVFAMLSATLTVSKFALSYIPNVEPVSMLIIAYTIVYRGRALIPVYVFVFIEGVLYGFFTPHFVMYLYVWTVLWFITMLVSNVRKENTNPLILSVVSVVFGLAFGTLCAPVQSVMYGFSMQSTIVWIANGFPWDITHAVGNAVISGLIYPTVKLLLILEKRYGIKIKQHETNSCEEKE